MRHGDPARGAADLGGSGEPPPAIEFAQAIMANWLANDVPTVRGGFRIGLATWPALAPEGLAELTRWLQFVPAGEGDSKYVFGRLLSDQLIWGKLAYLPGRDDVGRQTRRYWGHALIADHVPDVYRGHSPLEWWPHLPFFADFEAAKAARTGDTDLPWVSWHASRLAASGRAGSSQLADLVVAAFERLAERGPAAAPIVLSRSDQVGWRDVEDVYRLLPPADWGALPADSAFDGVIPDPARCYWVVGTGATRPGGGEPGQRGPRPGGVTGAAALGVAQRWAAQLAATENWNYAVANLAEVELTVRWLRAGAPELAALPPGGVARFIVDRQGEQVVLGEITTVLDGNDWPPDLVEHLCHGLRQMGIASLLRDWIEANAAGPPPRLDPLIMIGLLNAGLPGGPALDAAMQWNGRDQFPIISAWLMIATRAAYGSQLGARRHSAKLPAGLDQVLWDLPVSLLDRWARSGLAIWPGAPLGLFLPASSRETYAPWAERAQVVLNIALATWARHARADPALGKAARQWIESLAQACDGEGYALAEWFRDSVYPPQPRPRFLPRRGSR